MEKVSFKVKIGVKDLFRFLMIYNYKSFGGVLGIVISIVCLGLLATSFQENSSQVNLLLLVLGLLFTVLQPLMLLKKAASQVVKNPAFRDALEYQLQEDGILIRQNEVEQQLYWDQIIKVVEDKKQILVYTSRVNACIWPKEQLTEQLEKIKATLTDKGALKRQKSSDDGEEKA